MNGNPTFTLKVRIRKTQSDFLFVVSVYSKKAHHLYPIKRGYLCEWSITRNCKKWALNYTTILHNLDTYNKKKQAKQVEVGMLKMRLRVMYEYWQSGFVQNVYVSYCGIQGQILLLAELFMSKIFYFRYFLNTFETFIFSIKINLLSK